MTSPIRFATASLLAASLAFGLAACKPIDNDAKKEDKADAPAGGNDIAKSTGLKTEKEQASYMVGMSVGKSLEPIKRSEGRRGGNACVSKGRSRWESCH